eukprot:Sspe_Gene.25084::Locus_10041_Transcript_1_1_Confidence_1.000_Length_3122::g.25084::m.25084
MLHAVDPRRRISWHQLVERQDERDPVFSEEADLERRRSNRHDDALSKVRMLYTESVSELHAVYNAVQDALNDEQTDHTRRWLLHREREVGRALRLVDDPCNRSLVDMVHTQLQQLSRELSAVRASEVELKERIASLEMEKTARHLEYEAKLQQAEVEIEQRLFPPDYAPEADRLAVVCVEAEGEGLLWECGAVGMETGYTAISTMLNTLRYQVQCLGGYEVGESGSTFMAVFPSPHEALSWAVAVQRALLAAPWPHDLLVGETYTPTSTALMKSGMAVDREELHSIRNPFTEVRTSDGKVIHRGVRVAVGIDYGPVRCERIDQLRRRMVYTGPTVQRAMAVCWEAVGGEILISQGCYDILKGRIDTEDDTDELATDFFAETSLLCFTKDPRTLRGYSSPAVPGMSWDPELLFTVVLPELRARRELVMEEERASKVDNLARGSAWFGRIASVAAAGPDPKQFEERLDRVVKELQRGHEEEKAELTNTIRLLERRMVEMQGCMEKRLVAAQEKLDVALQTKGYGVRYTITGDADDDARFCEIMARPSISAVVDYLARLPRFDAPPGEGRSDWREALLTIEWLTEAPHFDRSASLDHDDFAHHPQKSSRESPRGARRSSLTKQSSSPRSPLRSSSGTTFSPKASTRPSRLRRSTRKRPRKTTSNAALKTPTESEIEIALAAASPPAIIPPEGDHSVAKAVQRDASFAQPVLSTPAIKETTVPLAPPSWLTPPKESASIRVLQETVPVEVRPLGPTALRRAELVKLATMETVESSGSEDEATVRMGGHPAVGVQTTPTCHADCTTQTHTPQTHTPQIADGQRVAPTAENREYGVALTATAVQTILGEVTHTSSQTEVPRHTVGIQTMLGDPPPTDEGSAFEHALGTLTAKPSDLLLIGQAVEVSGKPGRVVKTVGLHRVQVALSDGSTETAPTSEITVGKPHKANKARGAPRKGSTLSPQASLRRPSSRLQKGRQVAVLGKSSSRAGERDGAGSALPSGDSSAQAGDASSEVVVECEVDVEGEKEAEG